MKTVSRFILPCIALILVAVTAIPVHAQENPTESLTITEAQLNATLSGFVANSERRVDSLTIDLRDMEIILIADFTRPNGDSLSVEGVIVPSVSEDNLAWTLARTETVDNNETIVSPRDPASGLPTGRSFVDVWRYAFTQTAISLLPYIEQDNLYTLRSLAVLSVSISEDAITITYQKRDSASREAPNDPLVGAAGQDGTSNTIMFTEAQANAALAAFARRNERVESVTVDFTPAGVKLEAQIVTGDGQTVGIIAILIGLLLPANNGGPTTLSWSFTDILVSSVTAGDVNKDAIGELLTNAWSHFVNLQIDANVSAATANEVSIESLEVTNTTMIIAILIGL